jgi:TonB family protein
MKIVVIAFRSASCAVLSLLLAHAAESRLTNVSVRTTAGSGTDTLIVGFAVGGTGTKPVLIRGIGPSLTSFGVTGAMANPQLRLFSGSTTISQNDDWGGSASLSTVFQSVGAFAVPANSRDAALFEALQPGTYSVHLTSDGAPGIALVECYDAGTTLAGGYLTNLSARSIAGTGANVLTVGFAITGTDPKTVLLRGVGPALTGFGVTGALVNPRLRLFDSSGTEIADNDDWLLAVTPQAVFSAAGAFALPATSRDSVLFFALPPGTFTAQVSGVGNATGAALVEVYEITSSPVAVVTIQPIVATAAPSPADPGAGTLSAGADTLPQVLFQTRPTYPFELRRASVTGQAVVDFYVKSDGTVANVVAIRATDIRFAGSAADAVRTWTFRPGRRDGRLVTTHMQVPIVYTLNED